MIHGGGHMTLSKKAVRPAQTSFLLANGILPISLDYRLCPEVNLIDGPMADVRDAYAWAQSPSRTGLQSILHSKGSMVEVNRAKIMVIGWSTGGHLAMTTAWTTKEAGLPPPSAILSFYSPNDFESGGKLFNLYCNCVDACQCLLCCPCCIVTFRMQSWEVFHEG